MPRIGRARVHEDATQFVVVGTNRVGRRHALLPGQPFLCVRLQVQRLRKLQASRQLASAQSLEVKIKAFQVNDKVVGEFVEAAPLLSIDLAISRRTEIELKRRKEGS